MKYTTRRLTRLFLVLALVTGLASCKIIISLPEDIAGAVVTQSGTYFCLRTDDGEIDEDSTCEVDVVDIFFDETFVAIAPPGYVFSRWKKANRYFCGGSRRPCRLFTSGFEGNDALTAILEDDQQEFYLEPVFVRGDAALPGIYEGNWNNVSFGTSGAISLSIVDNGDDTFEFTLDLDGNVFGQGDPGPVTILARQREDGSIAATGELTIGGEAAAYQFLIDAENNLELNIPSLPIAGLRSFRVLGVIAGGTGFVEYQVRFSGAEPALGTATLFRP